MPHWNDKGEEEWVCQKGAHVCTGKSTWVEGLGNVCDACLAAGGERAKTYPRRKTHPVYHNSIERLAKEQGLDAARVIDGDRLMEYVGIGWIEVRRASAKDRTKYPVVTEN